MPGLAPPEAKRKLGAWYQHYRRRTVTPQVMEKVLRAHAKYLPPRELRHAKATHHHRLKEHTRIHQGMDKRGAIAAELSRMLPIIVGTDRMRQWAPRVLGRLLPP